MFKQTVPTKIRLLQINTVQCGSTLFMNYASFGFFGVKLRVNLQFLHIYSKGHGNDLWNY